MDLKDAKFRIEIMKFEFEKLSEKKPESKELFLKYNEAVDTVLQELENRIPREKIQEEKWRCIKEAGSYDISNATINQHKLIGGYEILDKLLGG